jgi:hypothetical protein
MIQVWHYENTGDHNKMYTIIREDTSSQFYGLWGPRGTYHGCKQKPADKISKEHQDRQRKGYSLWCHTRTSDPELTLLVQSIQQHGRKNLSLRERTQLWQAICGAFDKTIKTELKQRTTTGRKATVVVAWGWDLDMRPGLRTLQQAYSNHLSKSKTSDLAIGQIDAADIQLLKQYGGHVAALEGSIDCSLLLRVTEEFYLNESFDDFQKLFDAAGAVIS